MTTIQNFVLGQWETPGIALDHTVCNANTGEVLLEQRGSTPAQLESAIAAADDAHRRGDWRNLPGDRRAELLQKAADSLEAAATEIAAIDALTTGVPIRFTRILARLCAAAFRASAELCEQPSVVRKSPDFVVERLALGPAAIIAPWNAPAGIACHKLASALAAGCPVVFKPSEWTPHSAQIIAAALAEVGLPDGVFQLVHGDGRTGALLVADPRIAAVSFTGGIEGGRSIARTCAEQVKPAQLELGGNNPMIVLDSADPDDVADGVVAGLTTLNGQWCRALGRLIVHDSLFDAVLNGVAERLDNLVIGDSTDPATDMGPLVHRAHRDAVEQAINGFERAGGRALRHGKLPDLAGWFLQPTLVANVPEDAALGEVFGPVATAHRFSELDSAIDFANRAPFGLAAYVFGEHNHALETAQRLEAGMVKINVVTLFSPHPDLPRPAWKMSGMGDEGTRESFEFFRGSRVIGLSAGRRR